MREFRIIEQNDPGPYLSIPANLAPIVKELRRLIDRGIERGRYVVIDDTVYLASQVEHKTVES